MGTERSKVMKEGRGTKRKERRKGDIKEGGDGRKEGSQEGRKKGRG